MASRSNAGELARRVEIAAGLLAEGLPRTAAVSQLAERFGVDRRTARRYVAGGAALLAAEVGKPDLLASMAASLERLQRLSYLAEQAGNLNAAVGAEKAVAHTLSTVYRVDYAAAATLHGRTLAVAEPTERQRRKHRQSISTDTPDDLPPEDCPF